MGNKKTSAMAGLVIKRGDRKKLVIGCFKPSAEILLYVIINLFEPYLEQINHSILLTFWQLIKELYKMAMACCYP